MNQVQKRTRAGRSLQYWPGERIHWPVRRERVARTYAASANGAQTGLGAEDLTTACATLYSGESRRQSIVSFCVLASGSSGNAALLSTDNTRILLDAGLSMKELGRRLALIGEEIERIDAILITHEHSDHGSSNPAKPTSSAPARRSESRKRRSTKRSSSRPSTAPASYYRAVRRGFHLLSSGDVLVHDADRPRHFRPGIARRRSTK